MSTVAAPLRTTTVPLGRRLLWPYVLILALAAIAAAALGGPGAIGERPWLFAGLVAVVVALELLEIDLFDGGHMTPGTAPSIALALVFGPAGAVAGEAVITVLRLVRRRPPIKIVFDLGALGLSGVAAWAAAQPFPATGAGFLLAGLAAGAAYVTVNNLLLTLVWTLDEGRVPRALFRERLAPGVPQELAAGPLAALIVIGVDEMGDLALAALGVPLAAMWLSQAQAIRATQRHVADLEAANDRLRDMMRSTVESLARTIEARDPYTGGHTERVAEFAHLIAARLGFDEDELRALAVGAVIHDIGKIGIPDAVLLKPGKLDDDEWAAMRRHPEIGAYILDELELPGLAKDMARHHHERYDGGGYPDGLAGETIPLAARVLTVADALDAMTTDRPYRRALAMQVALDELRAQAGTQFCPSVVAAALDVIRPDA